MKRALSPSLRACGGPSSPSLARPRTESPRSISPSLLPRPPPLPDLPIKHLVVIHVQTVPSLRVALFPAEEKTTIAYAKQNGKRYEYRRSEVDCDGRMFADCSNCTRGRFLDIIQFAPPDNLRNSRFRPAFFDALQSYSVAYDQGNIEEAGEWRKESGGIEGWKVPFLPENTRLPLPRRSSVQGRVQQNEKRGLHKKRRVCQPRIALSVVIKRGAFYREITSTLQTIQTLRRGRRGG